MGTINQIKFKLLELEGGAFQRLCDDWLFRKGYENVNVIGMMQTTDRVVKGTPDSLLIQSDGKYVFSEYTVQQDDLPKKLVNDIDKCFDEQKTGISCEQIREIIICYLGKLTTHEINQLQIKCKNKGIRLSLNGLDTIALSIQNCYPVLSERYLGLTLDTGQLLSVDDFIKRYSQNELTTSIDNQILFQDTALEQGIENLEKGKFLLVSGSPGVGKTLFSVNLAKLFKRKYSTIKVFCIFDKGADLVNDITAHFSEPGDYLIFVDDANRLDNRLDYIFHYLNEYTEKRSYKIIATVRDYARHSVIEKANRYTNVYEQEILPLTDQQIKELIIQLFDIKNSEYQERIQDIAAGNARLAIMASKVVLKTNQIQSIQNVTSLYDDYFKQNENVNEIIKNDKLLVSACAISFFRNIDKYNDVHMSFVRDVFGIQTEEFWEYISILHKKEIVDLYESEVVKMADQILSTYLFFLSVFEKKKIPFSLIVKRFYPSFKRTIVDALNPVISSFDHKKIVEEIKKEVQAIFKEIRTEQDNSNTLDFLNSFWFALPTESLNFVKDMIYNTPQVDIDWSSAVFQESKNGRDDDDSIVRLLSHFRYFSEHEFQISFGLLLMHLEKTKDSLGYVINELTENYNFNSNDWRYGYTIQKYVVDKLFEMMDDGSNYLFTRLFIYITKSYLAVEHRVHKWKRGNTFQITTFRLTPDEYLHPVRKSLFCGLAKLVNNLTYKELVYESLNEYVSHIRFAGKEMTIFDFPFIRDMLVSVFDPKDLTACFLMTELCEQLDDLNIEYPAQWKTSYTNEMLQLSALLLEDIQERRLLEMEYEEYEQYRHRCFIAHFSKLTIEGFKVFMDQCKVLHATLTNRDREYSLKNGIYRSLSAIAEIHPTKYPAIISVYIDYDDLLELDPRMIVSNLFKTMDSVGVLDLINQKTYKWKKLWRSAYFEFLSAENITHEVIKQLLDHINNTPSNQLPHSIDFLQKYYNIDLDIFSKVVKNLLLKSKMDDKCAIPLRYIYEKHSKLFGNWFEIFKSDQYLAFEAYLAAFKVDKNIDHSGEALKILTSKDKGFLLRLINSVYEGEKWPSIHSVMPDLKFLWKRESYIPDIEEYAKYVFNKDEDAYHVGDNIFKKLFTKRNGENDDTLSDRKQAFIKNTIELNVYNTNYVRFIFDVANFMGDEFRRELLQSFLMRNKNFKDFQKIEFEPRLSVNWGSRVPNLEKEKNFLISILPLLNTIDLLEHRAYIEKQIENKIEFIRSEKKRDFLESRE
jgi:hypothetical protein